MLKYSQEVATAVLEVQPGLTASADVTDAVAEAFDTDTASRIFYDVYDLVFSGLADALELRGIAPSVTSSNWMPAIRDAVRFGVESWRKAVTDRLNDLIYGDARPMKKGEFVEGPIRPGDLRGAITIAAGGSASTAIGIVEGAGGSLTAGKIVMDALLANGVPTDGWLWHYAIGAKRRGFDGHKQLSGYVFNDPQDPELEVMPQDTWIRRSHYSPGDHWGCSCTLVPWVGPNWGEDRVVAVSV